LLDLMREHDGHITAKDLYRLAMDRDANISLATVYRSLRLFTELGLVEERRFGTCSCRYYEKKSADGHHHMVCRECGSVGEFDSPLVDELVAEVEETCDFSVTGIDITIAGYCPDCGGRRSDGGRARTV